MNKEYKVRFKNDHDDFSTVFASSEEEAVRSIMDSGNMYVEWYNINHPEEMSLPYYKEDDIEVYE